MGFARSLRSARFASAQLGIHKLKQSRFCTHKPLNSLYVPPPPEDPSCIRVQVYDHDPLNQINSMNGRAYVRWSRALSISASSLRGTWVI